LEELNFVPEWKASIQALDLQYELNPMCGTHPERAPSRSLSRRAWQRVSFADKADLYVGPEKDFFLQRWPLLLAQKVSEAMIFRPHHISDEVTFMAVPVRREDRQLPEGAPNQIMDDADIAVDPQEVADQPQFQQGAQVDLADYELESVLEEASDMESTANAPDWHSTVLFAIDFMETPLRLDWNDHDSYHNLVAQALAIPIHQLYDTHQVRHRPDDLARANTEAIIAHRHGDLSPGSALRLVLIDVEFHSAMPTIQPEIVRRVNKLPPHIGRITLLHSLGLGHYCRAQNDQCICWHNHDMTPRGSAALMSLSDGDYIRIAIPPGEAEYCHLGTRNLANVFHHGITVEELQDHQALRAAGWTNSQLTTSMVPIVPDFEVTEDHALLQSWMTPKLDERPDFLDKDFEMPVLEMKSHGEQDAPIFHTSCDTIMPAPANRGQDLADQPETIRQLYQRRQDQERAATETEDDSFVVKTWYLSFPHYLRCVESREVRLAVDYWNWQRHILRAWQDIHEDNMPAELYMVYPNPPGQTFVDNRQCHVIVVSRSAADQRASVITVLNNRVTTGSVYEQVALYAPMSATYDEMITFFALDTFCGRDMEARHCSFWHGEDLLDLNDRWQLRHGFAFLLVLHSFQPQISDIWNAESADEVDLMQRPGHALQSTLNPHALEFRPGSACLQLQTEFIQDLYEQWQTKAATRGEETKSCFVTTWMVDHGRQQLHCDHPRNAKLHDQPQYWTETFKHLWRDKIHEDEPLEFLLVQPTPPDGEHDNAGHVILIQNPHDVLITNLITVYKHEHGLQGPALQVAGTTHEHLKAEHIIDGIGHTELCYNADAIYQCEVWYAEHQLPRGTTWPGRSGTSIVVHLLPAAPTGPVLLQLSACIQTHGRERQTHGQVAHTHGPRHMFDMTQSSTLQAERYATEIINKDHTLQLPQYIELTTMPSAEAVKAELLHWGHDLLVWDCHPHNIFFVCTRETEEPSPLQHHLFCHIDVHDEDGCFVHSDHQRLSEERLMEVLCSLGYARAVILQQEELCWNWRKISFSHQEPILAPEIQSVKAKSPWPARQSALATHGEALIDLHQVPELEAQCILCTDFNVEDVKMLFCSGDDCLCHDFEIPELPDFIQSKLQKPQGPAPDLKEYDRLLIYTDGSSKPTGRRMAPLRADELGLQDTWAFLVLGEKYDERGDSSTIVPIGWTAQPVSYQPEGQAFTGTQRIGSDQAERAALTFAGLWRMSQNVSAPTVICTDSATTGGQAFGTLGVADPDPSYMLMRGIIQALQQALTHEGIQLHHTRSHAGDPYNEFVDHAAKLEARHSFNHKRQQLDLQVWHSRLCQLWMVFGQKQGLPPWKNGGFEMPAPRLPPAHIDTESHGGELHHSVHDVSCAFSLATANVQSLYKGPDGHGGKLHFLQAQMRFYKLNCLAIQEARSEAGVRVANNFLCFASSHSKGHLGVEIWFDLDQPIGWQRRKHKHIEHKLTRSTFCVVHGDPRRMLLRCDHPLLDCWFFIAHAPHSGKTQTERTQWWEETRRILQEHCDEAPMLWLLDANAALGEAVGHAVHRPGFATSSNTPLFRAALHERDLCLPATTMCHAGDNTTWTAPDGASMRCIDHIAIPHQWLPRCTHSQVLADFDLAQRHEDHRAVTLQLQWDARIQQYQHKKHKKVGVNIDYKDPVIKEGLIQYQPESWEVDVEQQAGQLVRHLQQSMGSLRTQQVVSAKKAYVTPEVWQLRTQKLQCRQITKEIRRRLATETLHQVFKAWTNRATTSDFAQFFNYGTSLRCSQVKMYLGFCRYRKLMRARLQNSKSVFLQQRLSQLHENSAAADILKELKPFIGPTNPRKQKKATLPLVHNAEDQPCTLPTEALAVWVDFFRDMEGGQRVTDAQLRKQWIGCLQSFRQANFQLTMEEVPTLTEMELAYRRVACKKATGPDGVPGEICRFHPELLAPATYTQMLTTPVQRWFASAGI